MLDKSMLRLKFDNGLTRAFVLVTASLLASSFAVGASGKPRTFLTQQDRLTPMQREIERQRQRLSSTEAEERRDALMHLASLKRPEASRAATAALNDVSPAVRVAAARAILSLPSSEAAAVLLPLLKEKDEFVRREVAFALGETHAHTATAALVELMLHDKKPSVRGAAAVALGEIDDESSLTALAQVISGPASKKKKTKSPEEEFVVRSAVRSLGQMRSRTSVPTLIAALQDETNPIETRREAATALGMIGDSSAVPALQSAYDANTDPYLSEAARAAIRQINRAKSKGAGT